MLTWHFNIPPEEQIASRFVNANVMRIKLQYGLGAMSNLPQAIRTFLTGLSMADASVVAVAALAWGF